MNHELWSIWKEGIFWKLQMPNGIATYRRKRDAEEMARVCRKDVLLQSVF